MLAVIDVVNLGSKPFKNQIVLVPERFEPSSRALLSGEQPHAWELLHPRARASRHRGADPPRRCGRSEETSLLSPE